MGIEIVNIIASFVLFGITGSGKSTLGNTVINRIDAFKEGEGVFSETVVVNGEMGTFDGYPVIAIDTPGMVDSDGRDQEHLNLITNYIRDYIGVKAFVVVINFLNNKIDYSINRLFQVMEQMYPEKEWYKHVVIVWSNYESGLSQQKKKTLSMKREGIKQTIKRIIPRITQEELNTIPQYFLDNIEARDPTTESHQKMKEMIKHISTLPPIYETLGIIQDVDNDVMKEEYERERRVVDDITEGNIRIITTALFERKKQILYSGKVLYTDYEEIEGNRLSERKVLVEPPPDMIPEEKEEVKLIGKERRIVDSCVKGPRQFLGLIGPKSRMESGRIMQKRKLTKWRRYKKVFTGGRIEHTEWEIVTEIDTDDVVATFSDGDQRQTIGLATLTGIPDAIKNFFK